MNDVSSLTAQRIRSKGVNVSKKQQNMVIWGHFEANGSLQMIAQNIPVLWFSVICGIRERLRRQEWFRSCLI